MLRDIICQDLNAEFVLILACFAQAFTGYSLNGKLVQVCGEVQSFYPSDGGQIDMESFHFKQGLKIKIFVIFLFEVIHRYTHTHFTQLNKFVFIFRVETTENLCKEGWPSLLHTHFREKERTR